MNSNARIYIAGHRGMVGSALVRMLKSKGYTNLITRTHAELDLTNQAAVNTFFDCEKIDYVIIAAAKVGGIHANDTYRADFIYQNLMIQANVVHAAYHAGIQGLLFLGSSCIYPKHSPQPMKEEHLLSGYLESTNTPYAIAKIAGLNLCESYNRQYGTRYRAVMPTNLYGPNDNFDLQDSHVLPAMIRKFHLAKLALNRDIDGIKKDEARFGRIPESSWQDLENSPQVVKLWGSGTPYREFLHVDDMATACLHMMTLSGEYYQKMIKAAPEFQQFGIESVAHINVGYGTDITINNLSQLVKTLVGYAGDVIWDSSKADGTPRKLMDLKRLTSSGWSRCIELKRGIQDTYQWYLDQIR